MDAPSGRAEFDIAPIGVSPIEGKDVGAILAGLSHELRRPLVSMRAGFDLLLSDEAGPLPDDRAEQVRLMSLLCDELLHFTRSYLDFAGVAHGSRPMVLGDFRLGNLLDDLELRFRREAEAAGLAWRSRLVGDDLSVTTDASHCQQIFGNLVNNALKFSPIGGEVVVTIEAMPPDTWSLRVADSGPGISEEERERVFTPFYRVNLGASRPHEGHGLGLAICRELTNQLGGTITLGPRPGGGLVATVLMPVKSAALTTRA